MNAPDKGAHRLKIPENSDLRRRAQISGKLSNYSEKYKNSLSAPSYQEEISFIGTIFCAPDTSPNIDHYYFILNKESINIGVAQGVYCFTFSDEGKLVGKIEDIFAMNEYFTNPGTIKKFEGGSRGIENFFQSSRNENYIAKVSVFGVYAYDFESDSELSTNLTRVSLPAKPGSRVFLLEGNDLTEILGLSEDGLNLGILDNYETPVKINMNRLINKHFAVLAMSGAGKSYLISVIIEELLKRGGRHGTPCIILVDTHGEYSFLADVEIPENREIALKTDYFDSRYFEIDVKSLSAYDFAKYQPKISHAQIRELNKILDILKDPVSGLPAYEISDIIKLLEGNSSINQKIKDTLIGWLDELNRLNLFAKQTNPSFESIIKPNHLVILDMSKLISMKKKQIIIHYLLNSLFKLRRDDVIPPFLAIIEEAHQYAPQGDREGGNITKSIIETIAREGRKFYAQLGLISQRPVKLSTTALSQCNTHIILRVTNPNDLDHIKSSSEALNRESMKMISGLPVGNALVMGSAVNTPIFMKIRQRETKNPMEEEDLSDICLRYSLKS